MAFVNLATPVGRSITQQVAEPMGGSTMPPAVEPKPLPRNLVAMLDVVGDRLAKVVAAIYRADGIDENEITALAAGGLQGIDGKLRQLLSEKLYGRPLGRLVVPDRQAIQNL